LFFSSFALVNSQSIRAQEITYRHVIDAIDRSVQAYYYFFDGMQSLLLHDETQATGLVNRSSEHTRPQFISAVDLLVEVD
jgi:hypothetical protein